VCTSPYMFQTSGDFVHCCSPGQACFPYYMLWHFLARSINLLRMVCIPFSSDGFLFTIQGLLLMLSSSQGCSSQIWQTSEGDGYRGTMMFCRTNTLYKPLITVYATSAQVIGTIELLTRCSVLTLYTQRASLHFHSSPLPPHNPRPLVRLL